MIPRACVPVHINPRPPFPGTRGTLLRSSIAASSCIIPFRRVDIRFFHPTYLYTPTLGTWCCHRAECAVSTPTVCMLTPGPSSATHYPRYISRPAQHFPPRAIAADPRATSPYALEYIHGRVVRHGWAQHGCYDEQCGSNIFQHRTSSTLTKTTASSTRLHWRRCHQRRGWRAHVALDPRLGWQHLEQQCQLHRLRLRRAGQLAPSRYAPHHPTAYSALTHCRKQHLPQHIH